MVDAGGRWNDHDVARKIMDEVVVAPPVSRSPGKNCYLICEKKPSSLNIEGSNKVSINIQILILNTLHF